MLKLEELEKRLEDYGFFCISYGYDVKTVYGWYQRYRASNYLALPFSGAWVEQPFWLPFDFATFDLVETWVDLPINTREEADRIAGNNPDL